jgi:hypothetical protein
MLARPAVLALAGTLSLAPLQSADARDLGQWKNQPPDVRAWYRAAELTAAAKERFPFTKCCDLAELELRVAVRAADLARHVRGALLIGQNEIRQRRRVVVQFAGLARARAVWAG